MNLYESKKMAIGGIQADSLNITTHPTKLNYLVGDTLDLTGLVVTATCSSSDVTNTFTVDVTPDCTFSPSSGATLTQDDTEVSISFGSAITSFNISVFAWDDRGLEYNDWDVISTFAKAGTLNQYVNVGDTKTVTFTDGTTKSFRIIGFNDGTEKSDYYPANTIDFMSVQSTDVQKNLSTDYSYYQFTSGFRNSSLGQYLNSTVYNLLPDKLKSAIIDRTHAYINSNTKNYINESNKLWILSRYELSGYDADYYSEASYNKYYTYFNSDARRVVTHNNTGIQYHTTTYTVNDRYVANYEITGTGDYTSKGRYTFELYSPICFRIG